MVGSPGTALSGIGGCGTGSLVGFAVLNVAVALGVAAGFSPKPLG